MIFFTSDLHLGHTNVIKYCNRPFATIEEMDKALIDNWNKRITNKDEVYIIGDFTFSDPAKYAPKLNGQKYLIIGNHDANRLKELKPYFAWMRDYYKLRWEGQKFILAHYAHRVWDCCHHGSIHLYGHSHGTLPGTGKSMDVGVDCHNFAPISIIEIKEIMDKVKTHISHHDRDE